MPGTGYAATPERRMLFSLVVALFLSGGNLTAQTESPEKSLPRTEEEVAELEKKLQNPDLPSEERLGIEEGIARYYLSKWDFENAAKHEQEFMRLFSRGNLADPGRRFRGAIGKSPRENREWVEANKEWVVALEKMTRDPNLPRRHLPYVERTIAAYYASIRDYDTAIVHFRKSIDAQEQSDSGEYNELADLYHKVGDSANEIRYRRIALKHGSGSVDEYLKIAKRMFQDKMYEECVDFLEEALKVHPGEPKIVWLITYPLGALERFTESIKYFEKYESIVKQERPEDLTEKFYFRFAAAAERDGDIKRAETYFQKSIDVLGRKDPVRNDKEFTALVYNYLGYMWLDNDIKIDKAGELIKAAADLDPDSGAIADSLGWFYFKKGRFEEAKKELLRSESLLDDVDSVILDHIAQVYYRLGDKAKAIEYLNRAIEADPQEKEYRERLDRFQKDTP